MSDDNILSFMAERFKRLNARFDTIDERPDRLGARLDHLERRQTASMHFEQSVIANPIGVNGRLDDLRAELLGMDRRSKVLEAR